MMDKFVIHNEEAYIVARINTPKEMEAEYVYENMLDEISSLRAPVFLELCACSNEHRMKAYANAEYELPF